MKVVVLIKSHTNVYFAKEIVRGSTDGDSYAGGVYNTGICSFENSSGL